MNSSNPDSLRVSVCICTRNRPSDLRQALESITKSSVEVTEVIVSDDSTNESTRELVTADYPAVVWQQGPQRGLGPNRNAALASATGTHALFIDDDAELGPQFIAACEQRLAAIPAHSRSHTIISGVERHPDGRTVVAHEQDYLGFQRRPYRSGESLHTVVINSTLFPISLFKKHRFDEQLVYGYDEVDLASRAVADGFSIVHEIGAVNMHRPSAVNRDFYRPHIESSRLYVTCKRRAVTERRVLAAAAYAVVAVVHLAAVATSPGARVRLRDVPATVLRAVQMLGRHLKRSRS